MPEEAPGKHIQRGMRSKTRLGGSFSTPQVRHRVKVEYHCHQKASIAAGQSKRFAAVRKMSRGLCGVLVSATRTYTLYWPGVESTTNMSVLGKIAFR